MKRAPSRWPSTPARPTSNKDLQTSCDRHVISLEFRSKINGDCTSEIMSARRVSLYDRMPPDANKPESRRLHGARSESGGIHRLLDGVEYRQQCNGISGQCCWGVAAVSIAGGG